MLAALSHARETQHYASRSGLGVTAHAPHLEAIRSSEVDVFPSAPGSTKTKPKTTPVVVGNKTVNEIDAVRRPTETKTEAVMVQPVAALQPEPVQEKAKDKGYQSFTQEGMQIALLVTVVALVGVNAFAFETLGKERQARALLGQRMARLEAVIAGGAGAGVAAVPAAHAPATAQAVAPAAVEVGSKDALLPVVQKKSTHVGQSVGGWIKAVFWSQ